MQCGNCGYENSEKVKICKNCGANLAMAEYFHPPKRKQAPKPPEPKPAPKPKPEPKPAPKPKPTGKKPPVRTAIKAAPVKPKKKRRSLWVLLGLLLLLLGAVGIFAGRMFYYTGEQRYAQTAQQFVTALVMNDEEALANCVHSDMHGRLRALRYGEVERCETEATSCEALALDAIALPIEEPVTQLYRVGVSYRVYIGGKSYACSMTVYVANIGGETYAVKTEAIEDSNVPILAPTP